MPLWPHNAGHIMPLGEETIPMITLHRVLRSSLHLKWMCQCQHQRFLWPPLLKPLYEVEIRNERLQWYDMWVGSYDVCTDGISNCFALSVSPNMLQQLRCPIPSTVIFGLDIGRLPLAWSYRLPGRGNVQVLPNGALDLLGIFTMQ